MKKILIILGILAVVNLIIMTFSRAVAEVNRPSAPIYNNRPSSSSVYKPSTPDASTSSSKSTSTTSTPTKSTVSTQNSISKPSNNYSAPKSSVSTTYHYTPEEKGLLYDSIIKGYLDKRAEILVSQGYNKTDVDGFINQTKKDFNRREFEDMSWDCLSKYSPSQMSNDVDGVVIKCFTPWIEKNKAKETELFNKYFTK